MPRGVSSSGRAPALHAGGDRFEPDTLHQKTQTLFPFPGTKQKFKTSYSRSNKRDHES